MALSNTGITTSLVGTTLGTSSRNVGALCSSTLINKWSKHKPFRNSSDAFASESSWETALKNSNYGMDVSQYTYSNVTSNTLYSWAYNKPRGTVNNEPYRLGDFRLYNHSSICPMKFTFADETTTYTYNSIINATLPYIRVWYRLNANTSSMGMGMADITLADVNIDGITTGSIGNYIPCVTTFNSSNGGLQIANSEDTLGLKFGTSINDMVINLDNFTLKNYFTDNSSDTTHYPADATNKQVLVLRPRINKYMPSSKGQVYNVNGTPSTTKGNNGYFVTQDYPFISVPDSTLLYIYKYERIPIKVSYNYISSVVNGSTAVIGMWPFTLTSASYTTGVQSLGGKVLYYNTQNVIVLMNLTVYNIENSSVLFRPTSFVGSIFPTCTNLSMGTTATNVDGTTAQNGLTIAANSSLTVFIRATYNAGTQSNYTFPTLTSPSYGTEKPYVNFQVFGTKWGSIFTPEQNGGARELRWR